MTSGELHYGRQPTDRRVLDEIGRSHLLGFRTILLTEYQELERQGVYVEDFDLFMELSSVQATQ